MIATISGITPPPVISSGIPTDLRAHPWLANCCCFTLPPNLLDQISAQLGEVARPSLELEYQLARHIDHSAFEVGIWREKPIRYRFLGRLPGDASLGNAPVAAQGRKQGSRLPAATRNRLINPLTSLAHAARGYAGWLVMNAQFRQEHDALVENGIDWTNSSDAHRPISFDAVKWTALKKFAARWRLRGLAAPTLPIPIEPHFGVMTSDEDVRRHFPNIIQLEWPDTQPMPGEGEIRELLTNLASSDGAPSHLGEWMQIISPHNRAKNRISRFARLFDLQHYWRVFMSRHVNEAEGKTGALKAAFGNYFGVSTDTIHADLLVLRKSLGADLVEWGAMQTFRAETNNSV